MPSIYENTPHISAVPEKIENREKIPFSKPLCDQFLDPSNLPDEPIFKELSADRLFMNESNLRKTLLKDFDHICDVVHNPSMDLYSASEIDLITPEQRDMFFSKMKNFLELDPSYARIVLYMPFEMLPHLSNESTKPSSESEVEFAEAYMHCWRSILSQWDVRANFVDGDIFEPELHKHTPRVIKAIHLTPQLLQRNILSSQELLTLFHTTDDQILKNEIADIMPTIADRRLLSLKDWQFLLHSDDALLCITALLSSHTLAEMITEKDCEKLIDISKEISNSHSTDQLHGLQILLDNGLIPNKHQQRMREILSKEKAREQDHVSTKNERSIPPTLQESINILRDKIHSIEKKYSQPDVLQLHPARIKWQKSHEKDLAMTDFVDIIMEQFQQQIISTEDIQKMITSTNPYLSQSGIMTICNVMKKSSEPYGSENLQNFLHAMNVIFTSCPAKTRDHIITTLAHWKDLNIIQNSDIASFNITLPHLDQTNELSPNESAQVTSLLSALSHDPVIADNIIPVILAFGSRLKGYAATDADLDTAMFIKPDVPWSARDHIMYTTKKYLDQSPNVGEIVEYWLQENTNGMEIRDVPLAANTIAEKDWKHILLQSAWYGPQEQAQKLQATLFSGCLISATEPDRQETIKQMERETLQYRLMHKGYARYYASRIPMPTEHANHIDPQSTFWDPGYRRIATKLYISKIFYPTLSS